MQLLAFWSKKRTLRAFNLRVSVEKMVPLTGLEPVLSNLRQILSAKTHSERSGIRLHQNESISYTSSDVFSDISIVFVQKVFVFSCF